MNALACVLVGAVVLVGVLLWLRGGDKRIGGGR